MVESAIVLYSIPAFFILIGVELLVARLMNKNHYRLNDAITSIACGVSSEVVGIFIKSAFFLGYILIYQHLKIYEVPNTIWSWIILFFGVDFFYYWFHRKSHEINAIWATHIVHHQSGTQIIIFALMMHNMCCPYGIDLMTFPMKPIIKKVINYKSN
jgi:sterol desaturase/sphingolipid hydroxylase (fatty acid hydroxylase superfamily)